MSADEFEDASQVINTVGVRACFERKLSDPDMRWWPFGNYLRDQFAAEWKARQLIFSEEAKVMFSRLAAHATEAAA